MGRVMKPLSPESGAIYHFAQLRDQNSLSTTYLEGRVKAAAVYIGGFVRRTE